MSNTAEEQLGIVDFMFRQVNLRPVYCVREDNEGIRELEAGSFALVRAKNGTYIISRFDPHEFRGKAYDYRTLYDMFRDFNSAAIRLVRCVVENELERLAIPDGVRLLAISDSLFDEDKEVVWIGR